MCCTSSGAASTGPVPTAACSLSVTGRPGAEAFVPPVALGRAVGCILDNAIRAAGPGGYVTVDCVQEQAGSVHVVVEDDGPGLGKVAAHTSMGLTITAALVSSSGGQFTLTPRPGERRRRRRPDRPAGPRRTSGGVMRLVVCDDHRLLVDALGLALTERRPRGRGHARCGPAMRSRPCASTSPTRACSTCPSPTERAQRRSGSSMPRRRQPRSSSCPARPTRRSWPRPSARAPTASSSKERPVPEIIAALERARDGHMAVDSDLLQQVQSSRESADNPLWVLRFLTDREWEVMRCILDGQTTEEMARNLGVQRSTARTHVQNLLTKLGVHSRLQVAALMNAGGVPNGRPVPQD